MTLRRIVGRLLFPKQTKFQDTLENAFALSANETGTFDTPSKELAISWLVVGPYKHFTELFLEGGEGFEIFKRAFKSGPMINADSCLFVTQAYYLRHILQLIQEAEEYKKYNSDILLEEVKSKMHNGKELIEKATDFAHQINNMASVEDFSFCYLRGILETQYRDKEKVEKVEAEIYLDNIATMALSIYTNEAIKQCRSVDSNSITS